MTRVGKHSGERTEQVAHPRRRLIVLTLGITATLVAWGFLVWAAIDFGAQARGGETPAWAFLGLATIGAAACLFLTLILGTKVLATLRGQPRAPATVSAGRRAAR
jgi:disulfide bond formation protein DsbB